MSACAKCGGSGIYVVQRVFRDHCDYREVACDKCEGTGSAPCVMCGEDSRQADPYCSDECAREDR